MDHRLEGIDPQRNDRTLQVHLHRTFTEVQHLTEGGIGLPALDLEAHTTRLEECVVLIIRAAAADVEEQVIVLDEFSFEAPKTKLMAALLKDLGVDRSAVIIQKEVDDTVLLVTSNLPRIDYSTAQAIDVYTLMVNKTLVCDQAGFDALMARMAK